MWCKVTNVVAMLDFAIFAVTFVVFLLLLVFYLYPGGKSQSAIPGKDPSDPKEGNLPDIIQAGSFQVFLDDLHNEYGPIASFYMGTMLVVSLSDPKLFEQHQHVFEKPINLFELYKPVIGNRSCLFATGAEGRKKHKQLEKIFGKICLENVETLYELSQELTQKLETLPTDQHIPVFQYMIALCMKICTKLLFGSYFDKNQNILDFSRTFEICWTELEARAGGVVPGKNSPQNKQFEEAVQNLQNMLQKAASEDMVSNSGDKQKSIFSSLRDLNIDEREIIDDAMTVILKYYSMTAFLAWTICYLATHKELQEKIYEELLDIGDDPLLTISAIQKPRYLHRFLDECLRMACIEPWTARVQDIDVEVGGLIIPKKTPVIHALGVALHDDKYWTLPETFDPTRFSEENTKERPELSFQPFGFAGKRRCPGYEWAYTQAIILFSILCRKFKLNLVDGQVITPYCRVITRPEEEVWITVKIR